ncbi:polysaccharide transporter, PST family [Fontimonas thermophila]|uniref:Polysaccharide transporter, PST family n=1 Tax=Fontimonas thermophila TaxID=1076937 RepID=A0A1I2ILX5_9GAMM|nr:O-antigen translocase [Fontimonas thermophila]SFF42618.1 polysaccharide transporter, PST family [Fontimonas thermophila]
MTNQPPSSYRTILRSSSIIGGSQAVNIAVGLAKMKAVAVLLGPAGVGLAGLYVSLIQTASSIAALGLGNVGTRQIAAAQASGGAIAVGRTRRALFWGTLALALIGAGLFALASGTIARLVLDDASRQVEVAWLSVGVALTVAAGSQAALLNGMRRVGDLARINVASGVLGAALGVLAVWLWGAQGVVGMVLVAPAVTFLLGHVYVARLGLPAGAPSRLAELAHEIRVMIMLGFAFMLSGLVTTLGHLAVRTLVQRELGTEALGHFQAAWAIGMTYLGFVLGAMGTDYYPRLTAAIGDPVTATRLVNEQTEVALLLCAPVLLAMLGLAPWVIRMLYTAEFGPAVDILRWQLLGDILKVMSWPLGFAILVTGAGKTFVFTESVGIGVFVLGVPLLMPLMGVEATGLAFLAMYIVYLPTVWWFGGRRIGFRWTRVVKRQALAVISAAVVVDLTARWSDLAGGVLGLVLATGMGLWALMRLSSKAGVGGALGRIGEFGERLKRWITTP